MTNKKSVQFNFILNLVDQFFSILVPIITMPLLTYALNPHLVGVNTKILTFNSWFVFLAAIGIPLYGSRNIAKIAYDKQQVTTTFSKIFSVQFLWGSLMLFIYVTSVYIMIPDSTTYKMVYYIPCLLIINCMLDTTWLFNGHEMFAPVVLRASLVKLVSLICIILLIKTPEDYWLYIVIYCASLLGGQLYTLALIPRLINGFKIDLSQWQTILKSCFILFLPQISLMIFSLTDNQLLALLLSEKYVGFYSQATGIVKVPVFLLSALGISLLPRITYLFEQGDLISVKQHLRDSLLFTLYLACPLALGMAAVSQNLISWFLADGFEIVGTYMVLLSPIIMTMALGNVLGRQALMAMNLSKQYSLSITLAAIVNIILDLLLIPYFGVIGCIVATLIAEMLIVSLQCYYVRHMFEWSLVLSSMVKYVSAAVIMYLIIAYLLPQLFMVTPVILTILQVITGIIVYGLCLFLLKDTIQQTLLKNIIKKVR